ncbi:uncharacterized protein [Panulirus ornatus]
MIYVDEEDPDGELPPAFPPREVHVKDDEDIHNYFHLRKEIGRGRFGTVYLAEEKQTGQRFAAKIVSTKRNQDRANAEREVDIMKALNTHPRLIQLYEAYDMSKEMCLVLEIVEGGELFERVIDESFVLTEKACTVFVRQICQGVEYIHSKNILHLDMKPENILCLTRQGNRVKICDFGLARRYDPRKKLQVLFGTPEFVAPEVVNFEPISFGTDLWSVGVICYVLLSGLSPFMGHDYVETMTNVSHNKYDFDDPAFEKVSLQAKDFIQKLLVLDKSLRLTPAQCLRHDWLRRPPISSLQRSCSVSESESVSEDSEDDTDEDSYESSNGDRTVKEEQKREKDKKTEDELKLAEAKRKELEKQVENRKKESEEKYDARQREEELERTKVQLKEFVERWNLHPNSPYLIGTSFPLDLQDLERTRGCNSRDSLTSVAVAPPSDHGDLSFLDDDGFPLCELNKVTKQEVVPNDIINQEDFQMSTTKLAQPLMEHSSQQEMAIREPAQPLTKHPSPDEVAKQLEIKLTQLQLEDTVKPRKEESIAESNHTLAYAREDRGDDKNEGSNGTIKLSDKLEQINKVTDKRNSVTYVNIDVNKYKREQKKEKEIFNSKNMEQKVTENKNKKTEIQKEVNKIPKMLSEEKTDKHKEASKECIRMKNSGAIQTKDHEEERTSLQKQELREKHRNEEKKPAKASGRVACEEPKEAEKIISEILRGDHKAAYEEYKRMVNEAQMAYSDDWKTKKNPKEKEVSQAPNKPHGMDIRQVPNNTIRRTTDKYEDTNEREEEHQKMVITAESMKEQKKEDKISGTGMEETVEKETVFGEHNFANKRSNGQEKMSNASIECEDKMLEIQDTEMAEHRRAYEEYKKLVNLTQIEMSEVKNNLKISPAVDDQRNGNQEKVTGTGSKMQKSNRELQKINDSHNRQESKKINSLNNSDHLPMEPLKRPEIIALQNEELGGVMLRVRKQSLSQAEQGVEGLAKDQIPSITTSRQSEDLSSSFSGSRSSTPTKQLKKQPSRDVPLQAKNLEREDQGRTPLCQRSLQDVDGDNSYCGGKQSPRDMTPESSSHLNCKQSHEERPPSRESDRGTRSGTPISSGHRRPSRDVPLSPVQMDRLSKASGLASPDRMLPQAQAWPDLIVAPQGENTDLHDYKNSLDVPVATLVKSPSGKQLSVPELTVSQEKEITHLPSNCNIEAQDDKATKEPAYVSNNKLVAWILDIGNTQNKYTPSLSTVDLVNQWESRDSSPRPTPSPSRDRSPKPRDKSPLPVGRERDKSPAIGRPQPPFQPLSREPSSDNLHIRTPWGTLKRSPSKNNLSKSPSSEAPTILVKETATTVQSKRETFIQNMDDGKFNGSCVQSTSPRSPLSQLLREESFTTDLQLPLQGSGDIPPISLDKIKEPKKYDKKEIDLRNETKEKDIKSHTLPRPSKLMKMKSTDTLSHCSDEGKKYFKKPASIDIKKTDDMDNSHSLKRKSKFPPSSNQKKKIGLLLFSAQDRISQFEQQQPTSRPPQRPITRSRSNVVLSSYSERRSSSDQTVEKKPVSEVTRNGLTGASASSRIGDKTQVGFLRTRLLDKVGKVSATLPEEPYNQNSTSSGILSGRERSTVSSRPTSSHQQNPYAAAHSTRHP